MIHRGSGSSPAATPCATDHRRGRGAACVPGLAEKLFPRQIREDPILLDRSRLGIDDRLLTNDDRVRRERLALRLAVGATRRHLVLSYPRLDLEKGRPRVPPFYALETVRASEGRLPGSMSWRHEPSR